MLPTDTLDQPTADTLSPAATSTNVTPDPSLGALETAKNVTPVAQTPTQAPNTVQNWYDSLSEDLRNNPTVQKYKSQEDQVKAHLELSTLLGHQKVALPKDEKDVLAIKQFNKAIGVPEDAKGYKLEIPEVPQGFENAVFGTEQFAQVAHKRGLTNKQAQGMMEDYIGVLSEIKAKSEKDYVEKLEATKAELHKEWGMTFDSKVKTAQTVMNKFTQSKEEFDHLNAKLADDPVALRFLAKLGDNFTEGTLGDIGTVRSQFTKTPTEAKQEYEKIMMDSNDIYWAGVRNNQMVPESVRKERVSYVEGLLKMHLGHGK